MPVAPELAERLAAVSQRVRDAPVGERNKLIREAHAAGGGVREIARLTGLTHKAVQKILAKG